jgi:hypothetical protein
MNFDATNKENLEFVAVRESVNFPPNEAEIERNFQLLFLLLLY